MGLQFSKLLFNVLNEQLLFTQFDESVCKKQSIIGKNDFCNVLSFDFSREKPGNSKFIPVTARVLNLQFINRPYEKQTGYAKNGRPFSLASVCSRKLLLLIIGEFSFSVVQWHLHVRHYANNSNRTVLCISFDIILPYSCSLYLLGTHTINTCSIDNFIIRFL